MKKLMMAILILATVSMTAQRGSRDGENRRGNDLTAEQQATLNSKKMTLALGLNESQSKKVYNVLLTQAKDRKAMQAERKAMTEKPELTKEQRYAKNNEHLDKQIAIQQQMQSILSEDQFQQFKKMNSKRKGNRKSKRGGGDRKGPRGNN